MMEYELRISFFRCSLWLLPRAAFFLGFTFLLLSGSDSAAHDTFDYVLLGLFAAGGRAVCVVVAALHHGLSADCADPAGRGAAFRMG